MCQYVTTHVTGPETHRYCHLPRPETETREANEQLLIPIWRRRHICIPFNFDNIFYLSTWLSSYFSAFLYFKYKGILVIKNSTESRAISPGKNRYMASFRPMASPTCSIRIPSVPVNKGFQGLQKSLILPATTFMTKMKNAVETPLVEAGTISTMTVKRMANQVSEKR